MAKKLTTGGVTGLVFNDTLDRVGAFMRQAGGSLLNADGTASTADSPQNLTGLQFVQKLAQRGHAEVPQAGRRRLGRRGDRQEQGRDGDRGQLVRRRREERLPEPAIHGGPAAAGPPGQATLSFTNCWGIAAKSKNQAAAIDLVKYLTSTDQQIRSPRPSA